VIHHVLISGFFRGLDAVDPTLVVLDPDVVARLAVMPSIDGVDF
jgi:hypothetical protein